MKYTIILFSILVITNALQEKTVLHTEMTNMLTLASKAN